MVVKHSSSHWGAIEAHVEDGRLKPGGLCKVDAAPYRGTVPPVTAFGPPQILEPSA